MKTKLMKMMCLCMMALFMLTPHTVNAASNESKVFEYLNDTMGLNAAASCGILANIRAESNFNPNALSGAGSYGLCQWTGGRKSNLISYCKKKGLNYKTIKGQMSFLNHELKNSGKVLSLIKAVSNNAAGAYSAGYDFCYYFERPANKGSVAKKRGGIAKNTYFPKYKNVVGITAVKVNASKPASKKKAKSKKTPVAKLLAWVTNSSAFNTTKVKTIKVKKTYYLPYHIKTSTGKNWNSVYGTKYAYKVHVVIKDPKGKVIKDKTFASDDHRSCFVKPTIKGTYTWSVKVTGKIKKSLSGKVKAS